MKGKVCLFATLFALVAVTSAAEARICINFDFIAALFPPPPPPPIIVEEVVVVEEVPCACCCREYRAPVAVRPAHAAYSRRPPPCRKPILTERPAARCSREAPARR